MSTSKIVIICLLLLTVSVSAINVRSAQGDPPGLSWASKASIPYRTGQAAVTTGQDGRIYVMGGFSGSSPNNTARAYDPSSNTWIDLSPLPTATRGAAAAMGTNGIIYVISGVGGGTANQAYNITSNTWSTKASIPSAVWMAGAATGNDGRIYVFGGEGAVSSVQIYNPTTNAWSSGATMPTGRQQLRAVRSTSGLIYAIGGMDAGLSTSLATVEEYDPASNTWRTRTSMPRLKNSFAAALGPDNLIYVFSGSTSYGNNAAPYLQTVEAYDPASDKWFTVGSLPTARREVSAATASNGRIYVLGGANGTYLTTNEEARVAFPNRAPDASVSSITPNPATQAQTITFTGSGSDSDGSIVEYNWRSSLSGVIGTSASFTKNDLPVGTHNVYFSVRDDSGVWSQEVLAVVVVNAPATDDPTYQSVQNASSLLNTLMMVQIATLLAAIAAVVIAAYSIMSRKKIGPSPST